MKIEDFKSRFKQIVYSKGLITTQNDYISRFTRFDKNGSHDKAIIKAIDRKNKIKKDFSELLSGKTYDEWKLISQKLSKLTAKKKKLLEHLLRSESDIDKLLDF